MNEYCEKMCKNRPVLAHFVYQCRNIRNYATRKKLTNHEHERWYVLPFIESMLANPVEHENSLIAIKISQQMITMIYLFRVKFQCFGTFFLMLPTVLIRYV